MGKYLNLFSGRSLTAIGTIAVAIFLSGCSKSDQSSDSSPRQSQDATDAAVSNVAPVSGTSRNVNNTSTPVLQPILTVWQEGHIANAVNLFVQADWNARPIFPPGMTVGLTPTQFKGLSDADPRLMQSEFENQLNLIKDLAGAVNSTGQEAASKGDSARARQCFTSLKQFGLAINDPASQQLVKLTGQVCTNLAIRGLAGLR